MSNHKSLHNLLQKTLLRVASCRLDGDLQINKDQLRDMLYSVAYHYRTMQRLGRALDVFDAELETLWYEAQHTVALARREFDYVLD